MLPDFQGLTREGLWLLQSGKLEDGLGRLVQSLQQNPHQLDAGLNAAAAAHALGKGAEAVSLLMALSVHFPDHPGILNNQAVVLIAGKHYPEALECLDRVLLLKPDSASAHFNRGNVLKILERPAEAVLSYERALQLNPGDYEAWNNCGIALQELMQCARALACFEQARVLEPDYGDAWSNRGIALQDLMRLDEAMQSYDHALALKPDDAKAAWNKSLLLILLGRYREGWALHEIRWQREDYPRPPAYARPMWLGVEDIRGRRLLIYAEQGLGDFIQFCRYARVLARRGVRVLLEAPRPLRRLLACLSGVDPSGGGIELVEAGQGVEFDVHCPVMSLPHALGTEVETIPPEVPYLFAGKEAGAAGLDRLGQKRTKTRVGLVWSGSATHRNDHNRSLTLDSLQALFELPVEIHCLQKEIRARDMACVEQLELAGKLKVHAAELGDFADTAGLVEQMDIVISVDTSVAHLAGAMGKKVWTLLPHMPDYRWMLGRPDSPWYPTMRLFRQPSIGDWETVVQQVRHALSIFPGPDEKER